MTAHTMLYVIAYDIPDDKRRTKVHKALCGFGDWTQFSLFECFLDAKELVRSCGLEAPGICWILKKIVFAFIRSCANVKMRGNDLAPNLHEQKITFIVI